MLHSEQVGELSTALAKAQAEMPSIRKDTDNPWFKSGYASLSSIIDAITPVLSENGLTVTNSLDGSITEGTMVLETRIWHASGQWIASRYPVVTGFLQQKGEFLTDANGVPLRNDQPQSVGSAISYARRYTLMALLNLAAADDDGEAAMGRNDDQHTRRGSSYGYPQSRDQLPEAFGGQRRDAKQAKRGRGRPPKQNPAAAAVQATQTKLPRDTSELYQQVMGAFFQANTVEALNNVAGIAAGLTDPGEMDQARKMYSNRKASFEQAKQRGDAARDEIKAGLGLPRPA